MKLRTHDGRCHFSDLKIMRKSPAHYRHHVDHPKERTRPMLVGGIADALVFGVGKIALWDGDRRKAGYAAFASAHAGELVCTASEYEDASGAAKAVKLDPVSGPIVASVTAEFQRCLTWEDWGLPCAAGVPGLRGGFDILDLKQGYIWDLKITHTAEPRELDRHVWSMSWPQQLRWYKDGCRALGMGPLDCGLICVEATPPHVVTVVELSLDVIEYAGRSISMWAERLKACEAADEWPGFVQAPYEMPLPEWAAESL